MFELLQTVCLVLIWVLCPLLVLLILVQGGAGDISSAFGGGGQLDSTLGVGANRKLAKITGWLSVVFLVSVVVVSIRDHGDLGEDVPVKVSQENPSTPTETATGSEVLTVPEATVATVTTTGPVYVEDARENTTSTGSSVLFEEATSSVTAP
jgi:protein translocase SecG subunit